MKTNALSLTLIFALSLICSQVFSQINFERNDSIIILNTNGDTLKNPWAGGFNSVQFSEIDLNLDGIKDLFVFDRTGNRVSTFINAGTPGQVTYKHDPSYVDNFPKNLNSWVLLRDYNCDGKIDIFTYSSGAMAAYKNTSNTELSFVLDSFKVNSDYNPDGLSNPNNPNGDPTYLPIYISSSDIPAIDDIDNDGDLDVLTFSILGSYIEYHKNLSVERNGNCNSLDFQLSNKCWGFFREGSNDNAILLYDTCQYNINNPLKTVSNKKHSGSALLTLDLDANDSKELVLGDISSTNLVMLTNEDVSPSLNKSSMVASDSLFPQNNAATTAVKLDIFPAGFYLDVNNDNIKDLIVAPNCYNGCKNSNNVMYYNNTNANNNANFNFTTDAFLQDGMIEVGEGAHPVFFDYNTDGLMDIIVGNYGVYNTSGTASFYESGLYLYENIGTTNTPSFKLIDTNYVKISTMNLDIAASRPTQGLHPTFGDLDNDNDLDMILGDYNGKIHYFINSATVGGPADFILSNPEYLNIDVGQNATPFLYDINGDNTLDLIIGKKTGYFTYYQNNGSISAPNFVFVTDSLGKRSTKGFNDFDGNSSPVIIDSAGTSILYSGSKNGKIYKLGNINGNLTGTFSIDSAYLNIWDGINSIVAVNDINNDGSLDLLLGNYAGGVSYYKGNNTPPPLGIKEKVMLSNFNIYPNPTKNNIIVDAQNNQINNATIQVIDILGKTLAHIKVDSKKTTINLSNFSNGVYFIKFYNNLGSKVFKVIKE